MTYNGWENYETWAVGMFLDGNYTGESTYRDVLELVSDVLASPTAAPETSAIEHATYELAQRLQTYVEEAAIDPLASSGGLAGDLLGAAMSEVNWRELAEAQLADHGTEEE